MKRCFIVLCSICLLVTLAACAEKSDTPSEETFSETSKDALPQKETSPEKIDEIIYKAVTSVDTRMDSLSDGITKLAVGSISADDLSIACEVANAACQISLEDIAPYEDDNAAGEYAKAAVDAVNNVYAAHIKMQDFLQDGAQEDLEHTFGCLDMRNVMNLAFVSAREAYLLNAGFTPDEITVLNENLGMSSIKTVSESDT